MRLLSHVRVVLADRVTDPSTIAVEDGRIVGIELGRSYAGAVDGQGAFCLPGLIDTHSDAIEKELSPRPTVELDETFALRSLESRVVASGITTICHGIGFEDSPNSGRTLDRARRLVEVIGTRRKTPGAPVDHRILYRVPARSRHGVDAALEAIGVGQDEGDQPIWSFEDHTPGQGQFRDVEKFKRRLAAAGNRSPEEIDRYITQRIEDGKALLPLRDANLARIAELARAGTARVLVHDCEGAPEMEAAAGFGAAVAEFPLSVEAARTARDHGLPVVMGAPNILLGGSHSGNVDAEALIRADLCTSLASDYLPSSLLAAVFLLVERGVTTLSRAVALVTSGAAEVIGVPDVGRIALGARADLVLVTLDGRWPRVLRVSRGSGAAEPAFTVAPDEVVAAG